MQKLNRLATLTLVILAVFSVFLYAQSARNQPPRYKEYELILGSGRTLDKMMNQEAGNGWIVVSMAAASPVQGDGDAKAVKYAVILGR